MKRTALILCGTVSGFFLLEAGATGLDIPSPFAMQEAHAQQMGKQPWSATPRNRSLAAQFQHAERQSSINGNGGGSGMGALEQFVETYTYNSSSTSIGNLNEISQILSDGSTGTVQQTTDQDSQGNQGSAANTQVAVDSETTGSSSAASNTSPDVDEDDAGTD
ncbi:hypothetical protein [Fodinicurvata sp. EGI_FJ10296]|uniref:hypothetical protein n=1 Tax=Fodinicurvata sp. EGI_FJ10296 TaxID=3231908 RepID=UPI003456D005